MEPLAPLSPSKQNVRANDSPYKHEPASPGKVSIMANAPISPPDSPNQNETQGDFHDAPSSPRPVSSHSNQSLSPVKSRSPIKYRMQDDDEAPKSSPPGSPAESTLRSNEGLTRAMGDMQQEPMTDQSTINHTTYDEGMSTIYHSPVRSEIGDETDITFNIGRNEETVGDLSSISAIPTDMTRFAALRGSPTKSSRDPWSPSKQLRGAITVATPGQPRPLLLGRTSAGSNDEDETPRRSRADASPTDLMNFTGQTNILIPPPESASRTARRSPSGRVGFPIRVNATANPTPSHRSQASVDREQSVVGRSARKQYTDRSVPSTPGSRHSMYGAPTGFGMDLLDLDLEPTATPRSIPTVTPRELETLRSEMQSRISGLEATLSGKEAEVMALKRAITDAEVRAGKVSEELRTERSEKEELEHLKDDMERRSREMEEVLRELKQNAFVEEREREKLRSQVEDAERRVEEYEVKVLELNASLETLSSDRVKNAPSPQKHTQPATPGSSHMTVDVDAAVKSATETVARELHTLYKTKHERKVSDLKLSYEKRWIKQVEQLRSELKEAQDEIVRVQTERDATISGVLPAHLQNQSEQLSKMEGQIEELRRFNEETTAEKKMVEAEIAGLKGTLDTVRAENSSLRKEVEGERAEKGELVAQVEVFLAVSADQERELERHREGEREREREREREQERASQSQLQQRQPVPVSPPRSDSGASSTGFSQPHRSGSSLAMASPNKFRNSIGNSTSLYNNSNVNGNMAPPATSSNMNEPGRRPRPMSMLQKPTAGKFAGSGIPGPGTSGLKAPSSKVGAYGAGIGRGGLMEGIARMGAGGR